MAETQVHCPPMQCLCAGSLSTGCWCPSMQLASRLPSRLLLAHLIGVLRGRVAHTQGLQACVSPSIHARADERVHWLVLAAIALCH